MIDRELLDRADVTGVVDRDGERRGATRATDASDDQIAFLEQEDALPVSRVEAGVDPRRRDVEAEPGRARTISPKRTSGRGDDRIRVRRILRKVGVGAGF